MSTSRTTIAWRWQNVNFITFAWHASFSGETRERQVNKTSTSSWRTLGKRSLKTWRRESEGRTLSPSITPATDDTSDIPNFLSKAKIITSSETLSTKWRSILAISAMICWANLSCLTSSSTSCHKETMEKAELSKERFRRFAMFLLFITACECEKLKSPAQAPTRL